MISEPDVIIDNDEKNIEEHKSFPCTPKDAKKFYEFFEEGKTNFNQDDNVLHEEAKHELHILPREKQVDSINQTIPMAKLNEFKKKDQSNERKGESKLFDPNTDDNYISNPLIQLEKSAKVILLEIGDGK